MKARLFSVSILVWSVWSLTSPAVWELEPGFGFTVTFILVSVTAQYLLNYWFFKSLVSLEWCHFCEHSENRRYYSVRWGTQKGHSQAPCHWLNLGILSTFTYDFKEPPYFNAKSFGEGLESYLMIFSSRGIGEAKVPSYTRTHFKRKLPGSSGGLRQTRHLIPPPEFLLQWLWVGGVWAQNAAFLASTYMMLQNREMTTKFP